MSITDVDAASSTEDPAVRIVDMNLEMPRDTIQPFFTFPEIYVAALKELRGQITAARQPVGPDATAWEPVVQR